MRGVSLGLLSLFLGWSLPASAKEWVVSPGSSYLSLQAVLRRAHPGDTIRVQSGLYRGPIVVEKSVQLVGQGWPVLDGGGHGTVVRLNAPGTVLKGFVIQNSGDSLTASDAGVLVAAPRCRVEANRLYNVLFGISVQHAPYSLILSNRLRGKPLPPPRRGDLIRLWYSDYVTLKGNRASEGRDIVLWFSKRLRVRENEIFHSRYGLHFMYCDEAVLERNRLYQNSVGVYLMYSARLRLQHNWIVNNRGPSGYGLGLKDVREVHIRENVIGDNRSGLFLEGATGIFEGNLIAYNDIGMTCLPSAQGNLFRENSLVENGSQVIVGGQGSLATNRWEGNFWSDYRGYDANGDGIGDQPYRVMRTFERLADHYPALHLFAYSPSAEALEVASRMFPLFAPQPILEDARPHLQPFPVKMPVQMEVAAGYSKSLWWFSSVFLITLAAVLLHPLSRPKPNRRMRARKESLAPESKKIGVERVPLIRVSHLTKRFGAITAVQDLSLEVGSGEAVVVWGANGAGKTTVLGCLLGLYPFEGQVWVGGKEISREGKEARRGMGYLPQEVRLHPDLTVAETIAFYARLREVPWEQGESLLREWGLNEIAEQKVGTLSGGTKQKLALAIALLADPPLLLLDEPTSNLDLRAREELYQHLERLKRRGKTLLLCTHRPQEVRRLADRVIVLERGYKIAEGNPMEVGSYLQQQLWLGLTVPAERRAEAASLLESKGFPVRLDGALLWVAATTERKAEPIRLLSESDVPVLDFELVERNDPRHA